jgi:predicted nucleic acid-binding Zn ribbon protein
MKRADQLLGRAIGQDSVLRAAHAQRVLREWPAIVGEALAARSCPDRYGKGTVWVAVQGSAWAQELRMRKEVILDRLRDQAGDPSLFTDVRFGVRPLRRPESASAGPVAVELSHETPLTIREIAERRLAKLRGQVKA